MPNCFSLTRKSDPDAGPVAANRIDEEMCQFFNVPVNHTEYYHYWYYIIGFSLAFGKTFQEIREEFYKDAVEQTKTIEDLAYYRRMIEIVDWLDNNFIASTWYQVGR